MLMVGFPRTFYLHILHEQLSPFHSLIDLLKLALAVRLFIESDKVFQRMAPLNDNESFPYVIVFVLGNCRRFLVLRFQATSFARKICRIKDGFSELWHLYISSINFGCE